VPRTESERARDLKQAQVGGQKQRYVLRSQYVWDGQFMPFCQFLLLIAATYYSLMPNEGYVIPSLLLNTHHNKDWLTSVSPLIVNPLYITGKILQFYLNLQSRFFAGGYKSSVFLMLLVELGGLVEFTPSLVGTFDAKPGLSPHDSVQTILLLVAAWQALTLPNVSQTSDDDDAV
jgi:hypothetical protein